MKRLETWDFRGRTPREVFREHGYEVRSKFDVRYVIAPDRVILKPVTTFWVEPIR